MRRKPTHELGETGFYNLGVPIGTSPRRDVPTLGDVPKLVANPTAEMVARDPLRRLPDQLAAGAEHVLLAFDKLLSGRLRGMFDGPSAVPINWSGRASSSTFPRSTTIPRL